MLADEAYDELNKEANQKVKVGDGVRFLNNRLRDLALAADFDFYRETDSTSLDTVVNQKTYTFPADHRSGKTIHIRIGAEGNDDELFVDDGTTFTLDTAPAAIADIFLRHYRKPTAITLQDIQDKKAIDLPEEFTHILVYGAKADAMRRVVREFTRADIFEKLYLRNKQRMVGVVMAQHQFRENSRQASISAREHDFVEWSP